MQRIPLSGKKAAGRVALVDDADYELVSRHRWHVREPKYPGHDSGPYAQTNLPLPGEPGRYKSLSMHTLITGWPLVDHVDCDGLNNQRSNLRPATPQQQNGNRRKRPGTTSRYKGVYWWEPGQTWRASIGVNYRKRYLGPFPTEEEAALAYDAAAREIFGEYARVNFPTA